MPSFWNWSFFSWLQQNGSFNICLMHTVPDLLLWQHIISFLSSHLCFMLSLHTAVRKGKEHHVMMVALAGHKCHSDFLVNLYSKCCPSWLRMSDCSAVIPLIHHLRVSKLFWKMTYSIFLTQNIYYKMPRKILFQLSCNSSSP